jgi:aspartyl-tRNA(Asn)/glutamyl-tRNA(Gln) amidotransferase subunit C
MEIITEEVLDRVAKIARIKLTPEEKIKLHADLKNILKSFSEIQKVDVSEAELYYVVDKVNPLRDDKPPEKYDRKMIVDNIPKKEEDLIRVPKGL